MSPRALVKLALDDRSSSYGLYGGMIGVGAGTGGTSAGPVSPRGTGGSLTWDDGKRFALLSDGASGCDSCLGGVFHTRLSPTCRAVASLVAASCA